MFSTRIPKTPNIILLHIINIPYRVKNLSIVLTTTIRNIHLWKGIVNIRESKMSSVQEVDTFTLTSFFTRQRVEGGLVVHEDAPCAPIQSCGQSAVCCSFATGMCFYYPVGALV